MENLKLLKDSKSANERHTLDSDVPESNPRNEDEERSHKKSCKPGVFHQMTQTLALTHFW